MTEADEFRKVVESNRRSVQRRIERAWKEGFTYGFILATIACLTIILFLRAI
jgi:hypothetical protein